MRVQNYKAGDLEDSGFDIPDKDFHSFLKHDYGYDLIYQWGIDSLHVSLYQHQVKDKPSPVANQILILHLGNQSSAVACETIIDTMIYAEAPMRFVHQHLLIYGQLFPPVPQSPPGAQI